MLNLGNNQIEAQGARHLADALTKNMVTHFLHSLFSLSFPVFTQTLTTLYLKNNKIGDQGAQHLADALTNNKVIHDSTLISLFIARTF